jgi:diguanylate cyclase (GGDEF)-like protein/PAS domain S-box-containing protein
MADREAGDRSSEPEIDVVDGRFENGEAARERAAAAAAGRDEVARGRDLAALARDAAACSRDLGLAQRGAAHARPDSARRVAGAEIVSRGGQVRQRVAWLRAEHAELAALSAADRRAAAHDRERAADDRLQALADRHALERKLAFAVVDRVTVTHPVGASERDLVGGEGLLGLLVAEVADYAIFILDPEGNVATWNVGAERLKGYRAEEIIGRQFSVFYPADDVADGKPQRELLIAGADGRLEDEGWRVRKDGTRFWANVVITRLRDADGTLRGYGKITRDLTERRTHELELRASEERFRHAFYDAPVGLAITAATPPDALGRFLDANEVLCELLGHDRGRLLQMTAQSLTHHDDLDCDASATAELLSGKIDRHQSERRYIHASGAVIDTAVGISLIRDAAERPVQFITQIEDVSVRKRYEKQLQHRAHHDPLTGLYNRKRFGEALDAQVARVRRYAATGALLMIDVDHFKDVNDRLGHNAGDELLVSVARVIQGRIRETDVAARLGGDEFVVLMTDGGEPEAQTLADDLADLIRRHTPSLAPVVPGAITASIGIAVFDDRKNLAAAEIVAEADTAMYAAKHDGRDRIAVYRSQDPDRGAHRPAASRSARDDTPPRAKAP